MTIDKLCLSIVIQNLFKGLSLSILGACIMFMSDVAHGEDNKSLNVNIDQYSQIKDMGGLLLLDARIESSQNIQLDKSLEFVEVSTPTSSPSPNHAFVWLLANGTTAQALKIMFDDGTVKTITGN